SGYFLVQFILNSLPTKFGQFQVNCNTLKEKWNFRGIKVMLFQEEGSSKKVKKNIIHLMTHDGVSTNKSKLGKKDKGKTKLKHNEGRVYKDKSCYFCKQIGHFKKEYQKRKKMFCKEKYYNISSNLIEVPNNTWWLDFGATTHISNIMQRFFSIQTRRKTEKFIYIENKMKARIENIETYKLILDTSCHVDLERCVYIPKCARNLIYGLGLGFNFNIRDNVFSLFKDMYCYGYDTLIYGLYCSNRYKVYGILHQRLGHISKERIIRLMKIKIFPQLNFSD
ncbi:hypothetical protein CR513_61258, partial [Mucuna pruriens]